jgi:hypothetical protein
MKYFADKKICKLDKINQEEELKKNWNLLKNKQIESMVK